MKILLDANGLDKGPSVVIEAGRRAKEELKIEIAVIGGSEIEGEVKAAGLDFILATETISPADKNPAFEIRKKKDSSITKGMFLLENSEYDAFVSGGSTGAVLAGGMLIVGRIPGVARAALIAPIPTKKGFSCLLDIGANSDCTPDMLRDFAVMGNHYCRSVMKKENPSVYLINNGAEDTKGSELTKAAHRLLKETSLNFKGNLEARYIFDGEADVIVTDGFSGNLFLKTVEGEFRFFNYLLKQVANSGIIAKLGMGLILKPLKKTFSTLDAKQYGGLPLLGLGKPVIKAHGNSDERSFYNSIIAAKNTIESGMIENIKNSFAQEA